MVEVGDWVSCTCSNCGEMFGPVVERRGSGAVIVHLYAAEDDFWEKNTLNQFKPYTPTDELRAKHIAALIKGEIG